MAESTETILARIDQSLASLVISHKELKSEIRPVIDDVQRIKIHLYTDEYTGSTGMIKTVKDYGTRIEQLENTQMADKKVAVAWGTAAGLVGSILWKAATWLFLK